MVLACNYLMQGWDKVFELGQKKVERSDLCFYVYIYIYRPQYILYNLYIDRYMLADRYIDFNHSEESLHE